ncbi:MAG: molybdopterin cofactor-binding domain-containing protein [Candidatus Thiodiazotropha sp. 6PLUC9]
MNCFDPDRRQFLKMSAASAGSALVLGISWTESIESSEKASPPFSPNAWLRIDTDDIVTIFIAESEMGQGTYTALAMMVAEELEADWQKVRVEHASLDPAYGFQGTGGSRSVRRNWKTLRNAGAIARQMLLNAGADYFNVAIDGCQADRSRIVHAASSQSVSYADLVTRAAKLPIPSSIALKKPDTYKLIGSSIPRLDLAEKLDGSARYGIDTKLPGMCYATIVQSPVFGGRVKQVNTSDIKKRPGIIDCFTLDEGVVVVAKDTWQAFQARKALKIEWSEGESAKLNSEDIIQTLTQHASLETKSLILEKGEPLSQLEDHSNPIETQYDLPFQAHMTPEPMNCTVQIQQQRIRIWAPTQSPTNAKASALAALKSLIAEPTQDKIEALEQRIEVITPLLGGGFGRRNIQDYVSQAVKIAHRIDQPLQLVWPRSEDLQHDYYHPITQHHLRGVLDKQGIPQVWHHQITGLQVDEYGAQTLPYSIPHILVEMQRLNSPVPIGPWRSVSHHYNAFAIEHFFDELAVAGGHDPLQLRLQLLSEPRLKTILQIAAEAASWNQQSEQRVLGCAVHSSFGSHVAEVVELIKDDNQAFRLGKVTCVIDCGITINPDTIKAQMEGSIIFALTAALKSRITLKNGKVEQSNFHDFPILSFKETPPIEVIVAKNHHDPGGAGEPGVPPLAPALANALLAAHGEPVRSLPVRLI